MWNQGLLEIIRKKSLKKDSVVFEERQTIQWLKEKGHQQHITKYEHPGDGQWSRISFLPYTLISTNYSSFAGFHDLDPNMTDKL